MKTLPRLDANRPATRLTAPGFPTSGFPVFVLLSLVLVLAALWPGLALAENGPANTGTDASFLRVALLVEDAGNDAGILKALKRGLEAAAGKTGAAIAIVGAPRGGDQRAVFREVAQNNDLVLLAEPRLHEVLRREAANFRRTSFGSIDTSVLGIRSTNIMSVTFNDMEPAFLAGVAAAMMVPQGRKAGFVQVEETPQNRTLLEAFVSGATLQRPSIRVVLRDAMGANPASLLPEMEAEGASVVFLSCGRYAPDCLEAMRTTRLTGISLQSDDPASPQVPLHLVKRLDRAVEELVLAKADGTFRGRETRVLDLANGGVELAVSKGARLDAAIERRLAELRGELARGTITLEDRRTPTLCDCLD